GNRFAFIPKERMGRDSNPRYLSVNTLSRRARSTTLPPIQGLRSARRVSPGANCLFGVGWRQCATTFRAGCRKRAEKPAEGRMEKMERMSALSPLPRREGYA